MKVVNKQRGSGSEKCSRNFHSSATLSRILGTKGQNNCEGEINLPCRQDGGEKMADNQDKD
ncbi:MAG: hypothetical protein RR661_05175, partial [Anaerovoracaceae bacterium]